MISEDGPKPTKSFCFESNINLGVALKALKNYACAQTRQTLNMFYLLIDSKRF